MRVPLQLSEAFGEEFQNWIAHFAVEQKLLPDVGSIISPRYLARSIVPHVEKLSSTFNRKPDPEAPADAAAGLDPYWKEGSNPAHRRLAYFLYFMPPNLYRVASVWAELHRLGFRWPLKGPLRAIEFGAGPASGACGIAAGEKYAPVGLPKSGDWALIEQDRAVLELGSRWAQDYFSKLEVGDWGTRLFHRKLSLKEPLLPAAAPKFNLWLMSFFLNESTESPRVIARTLVETWEKHLEQEGIVIMVEPALKAQSRKLLALRRALLERAEDAGFRLLLPCLGHQACGALASEEDWCHEEVTWWRPPYFRKLDSMTGLDRKTLPFSYLVFSRTKKTLEEILPNLKSTSDSRHRLVSPAHNEGRDLEFFICGQEGKRRARFRDDPELERGDILEDTELRGDTNATRIQKARRV
jgi:hypothetical protein